MIGRATNLRETEVVCAADPCTIATPTISDIQVERHTIWVSSLLIEHCYGKVFELVFPALDTEYFSLFYVIGVSPASEFSRYQQVFNRSVRSLQLNDDRRTSQR